VSGGRDTVAVRVPSHPVAQALIRAAGVPIAAPSANRFMRTSATSAAHVLEDLAGRIEVVLDGGPADAGIESTVVRCERNRVIVLRPGAVTVDQIRAQLARGEAIERTQMTTATAPSPGMMSRHYAPRTPLTYVTGPRAAAWLRAELDASPGVRVGLLLFDEYAPQFEALGRPVVQRIGPSARLSVAARRLFAALRALDSIGVDRIYALQPPLEGLGVAIDDRLRRAAERVVDTAS
jgi:L-threonylcarbamoyladenylate synthase